MSTQRYTPEFNEQAVRRVCDSRQRFTVAPKLFTEKSRWVGE